MWRRDAGARPDVCGWAGGWCVVGVRRGVGGWDSGCLVGALGGRRGVGVGGCWGGVGGGGWGGLGGVGESGGGCGAGLRSWCGGRDVRGAGGALWWGGGGRGVGWVGVGWGGGGGVGVDGVGGVGVWGWGCGVWGGGECGWGKGGWGVWGGGVGGCGGCGGVWGGGVRVGGLGGVGVGGRGGGGVGGGREKHGLPHRDDARHALLCHITRGCSKNAGPVLSARREHQSGLSAASRASPNARKSSSVGCQPGILPSRSRACCALDERGSRDGESCGSATIAFPHGTSSKSPKLMHGSTKLRRRTHSS